MNMSASLVFLTIVALTAVADATDDNTAPSVVNSTPANGNVDVDPALSELKVTFDEPMAAGGWSWAYDEKEKFPEVTGQPYFLTDKTTAVLPVRLEPDTRYEIWINTSRFQNFKDHSGNPAVPFLLSFETASLDSAE